MIPQIDHVLPIHEERLSVPRRLGLLFGQRTPEYVWVLLVGVQAKGKPVELAAMHTRPLASSLAHDALCEVQYVNTAHLLISNGGRAKGKSILEFKLTWNNLKRPRIMSLMCCLLSINCPFREADWQVDCASLCDVDVCDKCGDAVSLFGVSGTHCRRRRRRQCSAKASAASCGMLRGLTPSGMTIISDN